MKKFLLLTVLALLPITVQATTLQDEISKLTPQQRLELGKALKEDRGGPAVTSGTFDKWVSPGSPECVPLATIEKVSKVTKLTPAQFEFIRALFVALPPVSHELPPGDGAFMATAGDEGMLGLVEGIQTCARFKAPDFVMKMVREVGQGKIGHTGPTI